MNNKHRNGAGCAHWRAVWNKVCRDLFWRDPPPQAIWSYYLFFFSRSNMIIAASSDKLIMWNPIQRNWRLLLSIANNCTTFFFCPLLVVVSVPMSISKDGHLKRTKTLRRRHWRRPTKRPLQLTPVDLDYVILGPIEHSKAARVFCNKNKIILESQSGQLTPSTWSDFQ